MTSRIWGLDFLARKGSSSLSENDAPAQAGRKSSSRVQTLCSMKQKPCSTPSMVDHFTAEYDDDASTSAEIRKQHDQDVKHSSRDLGDDTPDNHQYRGTADDRSAQGVDSRQAFNMQGSALAQHDPYDTTISNAAISKASADSSMQSGSCADRISDNAGSAATVEGSDQAAQTHDSSTSLDGSSSIAPADAVKDPDGASELNTSPQSAVVAISQHQQQQQVKPADGADANQASVQQPPQSAAYGSNSVAQLVHLYGMQQAHCMAGISPAMAAAVTAGAGAAPDMSAGPAAAAAAGANTPNLQDLLLCELQKEAGLDAEQTARVAALLQRYGGAGLPMPPAQISPNPSQTSWPPFNAPNPLIIPNQSGGSSTGVSPLGANSAGHPGSSGFGGYSGLVTPGAGFDSNGINPGGFNPGMDFNGSVGGYESGQSSAGNNVQSSTGNNLQGVPGGDGLMAGSSGAGFSGLGSGANAVSASGLTSPEAVYGTDGLDVPGTAQVAVHNVPFKWCNADLEALFKQLPGYLDAQLLFHENGRSKGVGVGLFRDVATATEACSQLSGVQADGRKLELVLMSPDNHISFSCKQVAVLGLPWEYTAADVCELIEAAAVSEGDQAGDAGVQAVEVAYREDGKSEGRAIATFRTRRQAHKAITRLHGRETLAGLRMRLFYLHEQQQRQQLLSEAPQALVTSIGQLSFDAPSPAAAAALASHTFAPFKEGSGGSAGLLGQVDSDSAAVSGSGFASASGGGAGSGEEGVLSNRSSFEKDQGPVILHVSGLMESVTREQLRELFSQAGEVTKVDIPDGGRSMGYGFITFSNPQAAEQAMLLFNNYPLGGGAIHVAYSTSATAKARQQALRQARKATLAATGRASLDGRGNEGASAARMGIKPSTPRGAPATTTVGTLAGSMPSNRRSLQGGVSFDGVSGGMSSFEALLSNSFAAPSRHSFDHPGFTSPGLRGRIGAGSAMPGGLLGTGPMRGRSGSFTGVGGLTAAQLQQLQLLQAAGGPASAAASAALAVGAGAAMDPALGLEQLLMQLAATDPAAFGAGVGAPPAFGMPGTPTHPGAPSPVGALGGAGGLFGASTRTAAAAGLFGGVPPALATQGSGIGAGPGLGLPAAGLFAPSAAGLQGLGGLGHMSNLGTPGMPVSSPAAAAFGGSTLGGLADMAGGQPAGSRSVVVTGLPLGLDEGQVIQLFQICGAVQNIRKPSDSEVAVVTFDSPKGAARAIEALDGTNMPSGGRLSVRAAFPGATEGTMAPMGSSSNNATGMFPSAAGWNGMDSNRHTETAHPWEFVAPGLGDSNIFSQGSGGVSGLGAAQAGGAGAMRPEGGDNMFGLSMGASGLGAWGDGGCGGGAVGGRPPAPVYPAGPRQGLNRSPSPGVLGLSGSINGASSTPNRGAAAFMSSPVNSGDLLGRSGVVMPSSGGGSSSLLAGSSAEGLGLVAGLGRGAGDQQGVDSAGNHVMVLPGADAGGADSAVQHMFSPAGDAGAKHGVGSWSNLGAQQGALSAENGGAV